MEWEAQCGSHCHKEPRRPFPTWESGVTGVVSHVERGWERLELLPMWGSAKMGISRHSPHGQEGKFPTWEFLCETNSLWILGDDFHPLWCGWCTQNFVLDMDVFILIWTFSIQEMDICHPKRVCFASSIWMFSIHKRMFSITKYTTVRGTFHLPGDVCQQNPSLRETIFFKFSESHIYIHESNAWHSTQPLLTGLNNLKTQSMYALKQHKPQPQSLWFNSLHDFHSWAFPSIAAHVGTACAPMPFEITLESHVLTAALAMEALFGQPLPLYFPF